MADSDFLSFLVDETLKLHSHGAKDLSHLEHKLSDYHLEFIKGEFIPQIQALRFNTTFGVLDVPANWSIFSQDDHTLLDATNDSDNLLSVMKHAWNPKFEKLLMTQSDGFCYLVGLKTGEDSYVRDLLKPPVLLKSA